jgi:hypothetical protein
VPPQSFDSLLICGIPCAACPRSSPPRPSPSEPAALLSGGIGCVSLDRGIRVGSHSPPRQQDRTPLTQGELVSKLNADFRIVFHVVRLLASVLILIPFKSSLCIEVGYTSTVEKEQLVPCLLELIM